MWIQCQNVASCNAIKYHHQKINHTKKDLNVSLPEVIIMIYSLFYGRATHIPVGADQIQHLELACDIANTFNYRYGKEFFPKPEALLSEGN